MSDLPAPPRIFYVEYKSAVNGRVARFFVKIPYQPLHDSEYALTEALTRAQREHKILWFKVTTAPARVITPEVRTDLARWREAIARTTARTRVEWN